MKHLKALVAVALVVAMVAGLFPFDFAGRPISIQPAVADAQPEKNDATWTNLLSDAEAAASEGRIMSSGEWQYVRLPGTNWAAITGYTGGEQGSLAVPDQLDGFDVVCIRSSLSNDLTNLTSIEIPGNVLIIGEAAFPRGTTIAAVNASYAQTYARNNGYAFQNRSKLDFCSGVIDLSDIRAENFVRVSEHEVWLRELEAKRLTEGSLFFLADPNDLYQISYYQVSAINEPSGGFVTIECTTPSVDRILKYYEANNQQMVLDTSSVVLYDGTTLESSAKTRSLSGTFGGDSVKTGFKLNKSINLGGSNPGKLTFSLNYGTSFKGSYKVGLFTTNETEVEETAEYSVSVSYSLKEESSYSNSGRLDSEMKHLLASAEKYRMPGVAYSTVNPATLDQPFMQGTVVSIYGFVNVTVTLRFVCELKGSVSFTYSATTVTKTKTKEGSDSSTTSKTISRSFSGSGKGEFKIGVKASLEIYIFCVRIAALELFAGVKATASLEISRTWDTVKNSEAYGDIDQLDILRQMATGQDTIVLPEDVNINMIDCFKLAINWVAEVEYSLGVGKSITAVSGKHTLFDINLITFHLHLSNNEYEPEPYTDDWENKDTYTYTLGGPKDNMHVDVNCPYDYKTVKIVLPYDHNRIAFIDRRVPSGFLQDEPTLSADDCANLGYKFIGFHTDASLDANSLVTSWPQKIMQDTTYYVEAAKMHKVSLIGSDRKAISGASTLVFQSNDDANPISLIDRKSYAATGEYLKLPSTMSDGTPVDYWILVNSKTDLTPVGFSEATDTWKIMPGSLYLVTEEMGDNLFFCAVTGQDVALYFHTCIQGATYIRYTRRGGKVALPECDVTVSRFAFSGWADLNGTAVDGPISVGINSANALHYYAVWTPSNTVTAVDLTNPHIGSTDPGYGGSIPEDPKTAFAYSVSNGNATITGYYGNYTHLRVPSKIEIDEHTSYTVTGIAIGAFQDNKDLVSVVLPWTISSIGSEAFSGCTSLRLIDMSATSATIIPVRFAYGCIMLQCVRINGQKITSIESYAFYGCEKLDSLRANARIGNNAFQNCTGITSVELGAGVTQIGDSAFAGCTSIKSLNVPDSVTSLGNNFISGCTSIETLILEPGITSLTSSQMNIGDGSKLKSLTLGGTVTTLGDQVFANGTYGFTQLTDLTIETILSNVGSYILRGSSIESLTLSFPNTAQSGTIYSYNVLAGMTSLKTVRIDSGRIGSYMFSGNTSLETVVIGSGVSAIEAYAFNGCSGLLRVSFEGTPSLSSIGNCAFNNCTSLVEFMIPSSVNVYGEKILYGCKNLEKLTIEGFDGMVLADSNYPGYSIGSTATFTIGADSELKELVIGDGVVKIGNNVFNNAGVGFKKLTTVTFGSGLQEVGYSAFSGAAIRNITFTGDVSIGTYAFQNSGIEEVRFLGNANIGNYAFYSCTSLKSVLITGGIIGDCAFAECTNLESVILKDGVSSIGVLAFENCNSLTSFEIPDSVTSIGAFMLKGCNNVTYLKIGSGISDISINNKSFKTDMRYYSIAEEDGYHDGSTGANPFYIGKESQLKRIVIPDGITSIGDYMFTNFRDSSSYTKASGYPKLTEVTLPSSLKSIGSYAFYKAPQLSEVVLPNSLQYIGAGAFAGSALKKLVLPAGTASSPVTFSNIKTLEEVVIEGGSIGDRAFADCSSLKKVTLKEGVTSIGIMAFDNCRSLTSFEIPDSVTSISALMLRGCKNITYLKVGGGIADLSLDSPSLNTDMTNYTIIEEDGSSHYGTVGFNPFYIGYGSMLRTIVISEGVTDIGDYMFANFYYNNNYTYNRYYRVCKYPQLSEVFLPRSLKSIGAYAFTGSAIKKLEIPSVNWIGSYAFSGKSLEEVVIEGGGIGSRAFAECSSLKKVILKEGVTSIGIMAFENCSSLTSFEIPDSVTSVGAFMLRGCKSITYLKVGGGISDLSISNRAFMTDTSSFIIVDENGSHYGYLGSNPFYIGPGSMLKTIVISEGVTSIGEYMFSHFQDYSYGRYNLGIGYSQLTEVQFPNSLKSIGSYAFRGSAIKRLIIPSGTETGYCAFSNIKTLEEVVIEGGRIGSSAFAECSRLKRVILKEGVTSIGSRAFENCTSLTSLEIPDSVTSIGAFMLNGCNNLTYLKIGGGISDLSISNSAFSTYYNGDSGYNPFYIGSGSKLNRIVLAEGITTVGDYMFSNFYRFSGGSYNSANGYSQLADVVLPDSLQTIGNRVFDGSGITKLWLPDSLTTIHNTAFSPNITLFSNRYNQAIYDYATSRSTEYIYEDKSSFPKYRLTAVVPSQGTGVRGIQTADGELHITRGTEGETAAIPEGFVVLSTEEIIFTDPVIIEEPPIAGDYAFYGWFTDPELTERWNGTTMPAADLTLYARVEPLLHVRYAINIPSYGTENEALPAGFSIYQDVLLREYQQMPSVPDPLIDGYAFIGWFMDDQFEQNYLPSSVGTSDIVVYGQLHRASVGATYELSNNTYILTGYRPEEDEDETVYIPAQHNGFPVTSIGAYAFKNGQTREIYLPDSIISVDQHAFADSAVSTINVSTGNQTFASRSGVLYSKDMTQLVCYPPKKNNQSFTVPSSVTGIAAYAFNENGILEGITFQDGLTEIGMYAFGKCTDLQEIFLPDSVTTLKSGAFAGCAGLKQFTALGLTAIEGSDTETIPRNMNMSVYGPLGTGVLRDWFTYTLNGTSVAPNYNQYSVKLYVDGVLQRTISNEAGLPLSSILFDTNDSGKVVTSWYKDAEYAEAWDIENDLMPSAPLSLYASLAPVYSYEAITLTIDGEEVTGVSLTGYNGSGTNLTLPRTIDGLPVLTIGAGFLSNASSLNSIAIGDHVLSIDDDAMNGFNGTIYCDHGSYAETWATQHGMNTEVYEYTLSFSVDNASVPAINAAKGISVRLPEPTLGSYTFAGWYTDPAHTTSVSLDEDQFFTMPGEDLTLYGYWNAAEPVDFSFEIIENNVIITGYNGTDKEIVIPASIHGLPVTRIGDGAFSNSDMISIDMGEVTSIGQGAFENCNSLLSITLPDTISEIGTGAFANCDMLKTVHIGAGIKGVDYSWFDNCNLLHTFIVAESNPFLSSSMGAVYSKDGSTIIAYPAGKNQDSFTIPEQVSTIGAYAFYGQRHLVSIAVPESVSVIQEYAFRDCDRLTSFSASACITIGHHAFFGCSSLAEASFGDELAEIGEFAFGDCRSLSSIYIPSSAALDGNRVYFANSKLTIRGTMGSSAYQYATANNIAFFDPNAINAESIALSRTDATLVRGEKTQLEAAVSPSEATLGTLLTWYSDDESIAYVDSEGMVYALGGGTTRVYAATSNGLSAYCDITVEVPVSSLTMDRESLTVAIGETGSVEAIILPASATNKELSWTSGDEHVATVEGGVITAVSDGEATITATTHNGLSAELAVNVYTPVESVVINGTSSKLWVSAPLNRVRLTASVAPENATYQAIAWSTSNSGIATVDEQGVVTAIGAGTATITATTNDPSGTSATFTVTVGGESLTPIVLPDALRTVEEEAFYNDDMIRYIQLGSQVTSIGRKSFAEMDGLLAVRIPASTTSIAGDAFENSAPVILCFDGTFAKQFAIEHSIPYILIE